jgi:hypothetical protein
MHDAIPRITPPDKIARGIANAERVTLHAHTLLIWRGAHSGIVNALQLIDEHNRVLMEGSRSVAADEFLMRDARPWFGQRLVFPVPAWSNLLAGLSMVAQQGYDYYPAPAVASNGR